MPRLLGLPSGESDGETSPLLIGNAGHHNAQPSSTGDYELPATRPGATPFAAGRTLDVDARRWDFFAGSAALTPSSAFEALADKLVTLGWHIRAFIVAFSLAFDNIAGGEFTWMTIADIVGTCFYLADILFSFHVGFVVRHDVRRLLVLEPRKVALYYVAHGQFLVNLIACLPVVPEIITSAKPTGVSSAYKIFYGLRLLRLLRVVRLFMMVWGSSDLLHNPLTRILLSHTNTVTVYLGTLVFMLAVLVNLLGCIWWFVAELEGLDQSWAAHAALPYELASGSTLTQWMASVFFVLTTMTTNGYGDIHPVTPVEQAVACLFMVISVFYFGFVVNVVGDLLHYASRATRAGNVLRTKMEDIDVWMSERYLPPDLKERVRQFYLEVWAQHTGAGMPEGEYFEELPVGLRGEIVLNLAGAALAQSYLFCNLGGEVRAQLAASATPVRLVAGHNLYEEGDDADAFYVLQEGEAVAIHGMQRTVRYHSPALLGQSAVFASTLPDCRQRMHTGKEGAAPTLCRCFAVPHMRALTNSTLWRFPVKPINKLAQHQPGILVALCQSYLQYIEEVLSAARSKGKSMPRLVRIRKQVEGLLEKVSAQIHSGGDESDGADSMQLAPQQPAQGQVFAQLLEHQQQQQGQRPRVTQSQQQQVLQAPEATEGGGQATVATVAADDKGEVWVDVRQLQPGSQSK
ncbi:hypothetical protein N2152v2_010725 [Parachlorella kessleri]